jgi:phenylalanyl-tRNA synthetase beta chain
MKITYNWIKEYIDLKQSPEEIAAILTNSGSEVKAVERVGGDYIMDIEITPNRSDCLSYIGIARELSASTGKSLKMPPLEVKTQKPLGKAPFTVDIKDEDLCSRYTARLIRDVKVGESPDWLKKKIISMGLRPVNNIVDITNYILFELGQPMHAFDYDKIKGKAIVVRRSRQGEKITSIDRVERSLGSDMLVIADHERPIAIAGVMGGLDTEVTENTKDVLLESAYFNPISIRRTSYKLALISESSYRFERGVDPGMVIPASGRASILIENICGGKIGEFVDKGTRPGKEKKVSLRLERLNKILNLNLRESDVKKILLRLFLKASSPKKGIINALVPSFRPDIKYEVDLIEEVARMYGYENIATTIPRIIPSPERKTISWKAGERAKDVLNSLGLNEVITYTMTSKGNIQKVLGADISETINVKNYLSFDQEAMRPSLIPGILNVLQYNTYRGARDIKIFEMGNIYISEDGTYREKMTLCVALAGFFSGGWQRQKSDVTFFDLKGVLNTLSSKLGLGDFNFDASSQPFFTNSTSSNILYDGKYIGRAGCLDKNTQDKFDLRQDVFIAEIDFNTLTQFVKLEKNFSEIAKYPSIKRDISLIAEEGKVLFAQIATVVGEQGRGFVGKIEPIEEYRGKQVPSGHYGLSIRIEYRDKYRTLTAEEVDKIHSAIRKSLAEKLGVTLR